MTTVNATGLNIEDVLIELYNNAKPIGLGHLHYNPKPLSKEEAKKILSSTKEIDYLHGRVIKTDFYNFPEIDSFGYDRDNGPNAMQQCIDKLLNMSNVPTTTY